MPDPFFSLVEDYKSNNAGTTAIEFGFCAIAFIAILVGIIETGRLFFTWNAFQYSFEKASRIALVNHEVTDTQLEEQIVTDLEAFWINENDVNIDIDFPDTNGFEYVEINGVYSYNVIVPFLPASWNTLELTARSRLPRS